ncbi:MAG TPA: RNB domain-containing ribonuclease [Acidimicrobiales bacterium]|nr:RNB domain-containing ribonuclease [Acidimicrobiales bacterium]
MPAARFSLPDPVVAQAAPVWEDLRRELGVPDAFTPEAQAEAAASAAAPRLPDLDRTDIPLVTIDPKGSRDLDQAVAIERRAGRGAGYRVHYAIADVAAFVAPAGPLDAEAHRRGVTLYGPDRNVGVHPDVLSTGAASLLPDRLRPALLWTLDVDATGELVATDVRRARVRSRRQYSYPEVQALLDGDRATDDLVLLREVGRLRQERAAARGAVHLPTPEQEVEVDPAGGPPRLVFRAPLPTEGWNAEISLLTGVAAAGLMTAGRVGLLRTLPAPDPAEVASVRRSALALGLPWPQQAPYAAVISALDPEVPEAAALLTFAGRLLRGAAYTAFDGDVPEHPVHSAVAAPYAHCTAPLRRLADRYVGEICLALAAGAAVPQWARAALPALPAEMASANQRAAALERAVVDLAEAVVLAPRVGEVFDAVVVESGERHGVVQLRDPAVRARCDSPGLPLGQPVRVRLVEADPVARQVRFQPA